MTSRLKIGRVDPAALVKLIDCWGGWLRLLFVSYSVVFASDGDDDDDDEDDDDDDDDDDEVRVLPFSLQMQQPRTKYSAHHCL